MPVRFSCCWGEGGNEEGEGGGDGLFGLDGEEEGGEF